MLIRIFLEKVFIVFQESFYSDFLFLSLLTQEREILWKSQNENFISRVHKSQFDFQIKIHNSGFKFNCDLRSLSIYLGFNTHFMGNCRLVDFFIFDSDCFAEAVSLLRIASSLILPGGW